jgi:phenylalanyl-tRNA synthetase beta chain
MNISFNWLKQFIDIPVSAEETSKLLTDIGLEVDGLERVESVKGGLQGWVIGEVLKKEKHPHTFSNFFRRRFYV